MERGFGPINGPGAELSQIVVKKWCPERHRRQLLLNGNPTFSTRRSQIVGDEGADQFDRCFMTRKSKFD